MAGFNGVVLRTTYKPPQIVKIIMTTGNIDSILRKWSKRPNQSNEMEALLAVNDLIAVDSYKSRPVLIIKFHTGFNLQDLIRSRAIKTKDQLQLFLNLTRYSLEQLEKVGFFHGDISLRNIIFDLKPLNSSKYNIEYGNPESGFYIFQRKELIAHLIDFGSAMDARSVSADQRTDFKKVDQKKFAKMQLKAQDLYELVNGKS